MPRTVRLTPCCVAALLAACLALAGCAAKQQHKTARAQLEAGQYEAAMQTLDRAVREHPQDVELRSLWGRARNEALTRLLTEAGAARARGQFDDAEALLLRAAKLDPDSARVRELMQALEVERRQTAALDEAEARVAKGQPGSALRIAAEALRANPRHAGLVALQRRLELEQRQQQLDVARGSLAEARPISLDFRDTGLRSVLDVVTRQSGVGFVLDKDIRADLRVTLFLNNVKVEDALDLIVSTHQLSKKVLDSRTVLIYPNTPEKQREYQEQVVRVFYLASAEAKQAAAMLRTSLKLKELFVDERSNMLILREPPEMIQLAERLLMVYDAAEPEVTLELEVLEITSNRLTELGIKFPDTLALTPLPEKGVTGLTVSSLRNIGTDRIGVSVSGLLLNLRREVGDFETLANPRVRIKNREKAKVMVGSKFPVVTTTASATGFVSESVSYLDVGLKLDLEPVINADDDVTIRVGLEVSSLARQIKTNSGTLAYELGTRNASTVLRLRDGETQVLAGLVSREERSSASRVPGLGDVPVVGRLFSSQLDNGARTELVLAITPRVVRNVRRPEVSESEMWIGTDNYTRLRAPGGRVLPAEAQPAAGQAAATDARPTGNAPAIAAQPEASRPAGDPATDPRTQATYGGEWQLSWRAPRTVKIGEEFEVELLGNAASPLRGMNLQMRVKPGIASLLDGRAGGWWTRDRTEVSITKALDANADQWQFGVIRRAAQGIDGSGVLATLRIKALKEGQIDWALLQATPLAAGPRVPRSGPLPSLKIEVTK